jgi:MFS family permease
VLRQRGFVVLLAATAITAFGDMVLYLALGIWVKDLTGSNALAGAVFFALALAAVVAPFTGHLVDRVSRRRLLLTLNVVMGVVVSALLLVRDEGDVWLVYGVAALYGAALNLSSAARAGQLKDIVPDAGSPPRTAPSIPWLRRFGYWRHWLARGCTPGSVAVAWCSWT